MARSYRPVIRDQEFLLPPNMADWLPEDHLAWFVLDLVAQLDTSRFHARRRTGGVGRRGYDPDMLLALLLYAYAVGERSSRRIERLCLDHVAFRVLCGQDAPDHTTIARFRAEHQDAFADVFTQVLRLCAAAGMVQVGVVSIDGTKIAANAARGANRSHDAVREEARRIAEAIVAEAAKVDAAEDSGVGHDRSDDDLPPGFAERSGRAANIKRALDELDRQDAEHRQADQSDRTHVEEYFQRIEAGEAVMGVPPAGVDPVRYHRARVNRQRQRIADLDGIRGADAARARSEARRALRRAVEALERAEDQAAAGRVDLRGRAERRRERRDRNARARGGTGRSVNVTDPDSRLMTHGAGGGSVQGYNAQLAVTDDHLILGIHLSQDANDTNCFGPTLSAAVTATADLNVTIGTVLADAGYFTSDNLTLPGPDRLIAPGKNRDLLAKARSAPASGPPPADATAEDVMRYRVRTPEGAQTYKRRSATVETVIAHLKDQAGLRRFARRGLPAVTAELHLAATVINLRRMHAAAPSTC
jgi:transposase